MKKIAIGLLAICVACAQESKLETLAELPSELGENSACEAISGQIWTVQDRGNDAVAYAFDKSGKMLNKVKISGVSNNDWEDLASDEDGNLYIGDFGNNDNDRKDLAIYRIENRDLHSQKASASAKTTFFYPEQTAFPPKKTQRLFDCEAFFASDGYFYLFTKNRSSGFDGTTSLYKVPNKPGNFAAQKISEFKTCGKFNRCAITSADISPSGNQIALLTGDKVFLFTEFKSGDFFSGKHEVIELGHFSQKEGLGFASENEILVTDEKSKKIGGNLYSLDLSKAKP